MAKNHTKITNRIVIVSGDIAEIYDYEFPVGYNFDPLRTNYNKSKIIANRRSDSLSRTRRAIFRIISCNQCKYGLSNKFYTLTFKENIQNISVAMPFFKKFIRNLYIHEGIRAKYLTVIEFQERGAVHFHSIFFNLPFISSSKIERYWGQGFVKIKELGHIRSIAGYVSKYFRKDCDDIRLFGKKGYFCSKV